MNCIHLVTSLSCPRLHIRQNWYKRACTQGHVYVFDANQRQKQTDRQKRALENLHHKFALLFLFLVGSFVTGSALSLFLCYGFICEQMQFLLSSAISGNRIMVIHEFPGFHLSFLSSVVCLCFAMLLVISSVTNPLFPAPTPFSFFRNLDSVYGFKITFIYKFCACQSKREKGSAVNVHLTKIIISLG